ncbi:MAG: UDP-N-acetylmuramate--L-alanine ligase [Clostridiaceae bacterium]|nr:UDP-N-acetylmuramate--L-alanine ligase [Clostridiaceae bacterium]MBW4860799.1 UDP-N-acetylmuramate--L-alanine ligase [Clostridiaceae bacterium]MBW4867424.1 UDP-N-acetylmuramate--L-alanine ligase [Clostridiaceae bacterium]
MVSHVHLIGIGGISMSGLAEILLKEGYTVSGSDMNSSLIIDKLKKQGANIYTNHKKENIQGADLVIYTDAISNDNPELLEAKKNGITTLDRGTFLGKLMKNYDKSIAVSGTHGKTTTTSMLATILNKSSLEPTILLGGELDEIGGNVKIGSKNLVLTEACEYKGNILKYQPTMAIILNMEEDHLDYFKNIDHIVDTFKEYANNLDEDGHLIINIDDENANKVIKDSRCNIVTFGINNKADYTAENISFTNEGYPKFVLNIKDKGTFPITLNVMGIHNVYNSLASIAAAHTYNVPIESIINSMQYYKGTHRRLETKGYINGIKIMDDYAHHPTEIKAALNALRKSTSQKLWCVFQPHTYSRTKLLLDQFSESFYEADKVIIADIYASREKDTGIIHSTSLVNSLKERNVEAIYLKSFEEIKNYLFDNMEDGDVLVTMGAGNIYKLGELMLKESKKEAI